MYNKDNINGVVFRYGSRLGKKYTVCNVKADSCEVRWGTGDFERSHYQVSQVVERLNEGTDWIPEQPPIVNNYNLY